MKRARRACDHCRQKRVSSNLLPVSVSSGADVSCKLKCSPSGEIQACANCRIYDKACVYSSRASTVESTCQPTTTLPGGSTLPTVPMGTPAQQNSHSGCRVTWPTAVDFHDSHSITQISRAAQQDRAQMRNAVAPPATSADCETTPIPVGTGDLADKLLGRALKEPHSQGQSTDVLSGVSSPVNRIVLKLSAA